MLSMNAMSSGQAGYYLGLAREDYYLEGGEPPGAWYGEGARKLGLLGEVQADQLYNLFDGYAPDGSRPLVQFQKHGDNAVHRPGWDLTFSVPKSVSVMWAQVSDETRYAFQDAVKRSACAALDYLQDVAAVTRRGAGKTDRAELVVALFEHSTSRLLDPQLHYHCLVLNVCTREDGTTGTVSSMSFFRHKMVAGLLFRAHLSAILTQELGIPCHREGSWFEVSGVDEGLLKEFSKRSESINEERERIGQSDARTAARITLATREVKPEVPSREELFNEWVRVGIEHGWSREQADRLVRSFIDMSSPQESFRMSAEGAAAKLTLSQAHFSEKEFIRLVAENSQGEGLYAPDIIALSREHLSQSNGIVRLGVHFGESRYTTREMLAIEESLLGNCEKLSRREDHSLPAEVAMGALARIEGLSLEQTRAVWHVTVETEGLAVVSGMAGAGKTRMLEAAVDAWESAGKTVIGGALAARAAKELEAGADVDSRTLARLFHQIESGNLRLTPNHVLIVDEAGMVATPEMDRLSRICLDAGCKLVLVGDERQIQPIGPGAPFRELGERYGQAELKEIRRQEEEWARQAVQDFADGKAEEALGAFIQRGLLKVTESKQDAIQLLVDDWSAEGLRPQDTMLIAGTRADVAQLNVAAQQSRLSRGEIGGEPIQFSSGELFVGDRVMFTKAYPVLGVVNGDRGFLENYDSERGSASVRLDDGSRVSFEVAAMHHLHLGYASTGHKGQGATTVRSYVLAGGVMQDREMSYVQASRAKERTTFYLPGDGSGVEVEHLIRDMARSRQKEMATSLLSVEQSRQNEIER